MKVAMCVGAYEGGGMGTVIDSLVPELVAQGADVEIFAKRILVEPQKGLKITRVSSKSPKTIALLDKFDIVHVNGGSSLTLPASLSKRPKVFTYHGQTPPELHGGARKYVMAMAIELLYKATIPKYDRVVCTSRFLKGDAARRFGAGKSIVIPNGVDLTIFGKKTPKTSGFIRKKYAGPLLLGVGSLYPVKDWDEMLSCFEKFLELKPEATLLIAGEGAQRRDLERAISKGPLTNHVALLGNLSPKSLNIYYNACDLYVSASPYEGFCLPAVEALACGRPLCVRRRGAMEGHAADSGCGTTFEGPAEFASAALRALEMDARVVRKKSSAYVAKFSWKKIASQYVKLFEGMVD